jgi:hypothetical protein
MQRGNVKVIMLIPCMRIHPYVEKFGSELYNTCIGVFRNLALFDFPSLPRDFHVLGFIEITGESSIYMRIVGNTDNILASTDKGAIRIDSDTKGLINLDFNFKNVVFKERGIHRFQLLSDENIIYEYDFIVSKLQRREYTPREVEEILQDPETIKRSNVTVRCDCGFSKNFSLDLDPKKQNMLEMLPEENFLICEKCGKEISISPEMKASMVFYLGTKNIVDTISRNLYESRLLAMKGFFNSALIMQVSAFEAFMKDTFVTGYKNWFIYDIDENKEINEQVNFAKNKILTTLGKMKVKSEFLDQILMDAERNRGNIEEIVVYNSIIKLILFGDENQEPIVNKINFQKLQKEMGCFWAYKTFFGINIIDELKNKQKDYDYLMHLAESFKTRHKIIHNSSEVQLIGSGVNSVVLQRNEEIILLIRKHLIAELLKLDNKRMRLEHA